MQIVFHYDAGPRLAARFAVLAADGLDVSVCAEHDRATRRRLLGEAEVLWHVLEPVTAEILADAPRLRLIQKIGVGVNTIDLDAAKRRDIAVCNMPGTNTRAVAEHTLGLMLAALRRVAHYDRATRAGNGWRLPPATQDHLGEIAGRTVGLVGYGAVPQTLAPILRAMGATVVYYARRPHPDAPDGLRSFDGLLAESDIVSLHLPLTPATDRLVDAAALARLRPGAVLVNTARGGLVDQVAMCRALRGGALAAAGLDVFAEEPVDPAEPLLGLDNVVVTPHIAWLTGETFARSIDVAVENCRRLTAGQPLLHPVA